MNREVVAHKINIQKYVVFLCPNNELDETEIQKTIPFKITIKKKKNKISRNKFNQKGERHVY